MLPSVTPMRFRKKTPKTKQKSKQIIHLLQVFRVIDLIVNIWHHLQGSAQ